MIISNYFKIYNDTTIRPTKQLPPANVLMTTLMSDYHSSV